MRGRIVSEGYDKSEGPSIKWELLTRCPQCGNNPKYGKHKCQECGGKGYLMNGKALPQTFEAAWGFDDKAKKRK